MFLLLFLDSENAMKFPSQRRLKLKELQSLQWFSQASCTAELPSLEKLSLSSLPKMFSFYESEQSAQRQTPFIKEIVLPNLEQLKLTDMEGIEKLVEEEHWAIGISESENSYHYHVGQPEVFPHKSTGKNRTAQSTNLCFTSRTI